MVLISSEPFDWSLLNSFIFFWISLLISESFFSASSPMLDISICTSSMCSLALSTNSKCWASIFIILASKSRSALGDKPPIWSSIRFNLLFIWCIESMLLSSVSSEFPAETCFCLRSPEMMNGNSSLPSFRLFDSSSSRNLM